MHLASFMTKSVPTYGVSVQDGIIDARRLDRVGGASPPDTLQALVEAGREGLEALKRAVDGYDGAILSLADIIFLAPIRRPGKILCLALNNSANAARIISGPSNPAFFSKPSSSLIGHGAAIPLRPAYGRVHPEPELAAIIGTGGKDIAAADAYEHVFGYTIHNDITSPTMRAEDTYNYRAIHPDGAGGVRHVDTWVSYPGRYKGADGFAPMGPWVATRDAVPDPHALAISCWHGAEQITRDNTANLTHHLPSVIAWISHFMTLEAGDIISMGTALSAAGSNGKAIQNVDLSELGGPVTVTIESIGTLTSEVSRT